MKNIFFLVLLFLGYHELVAQATGTISGVVRDKNTQEPLIGAGVLLQGTTIGAQTDVDGRFTISNIPVKTYNLVVSYLGYESQTLFNIVISSGNIQNFNVELTEEQKTLGEAVIVSRTFGKKTETPLSVQNLTSEEIKSNPGGNFDISRVIQALPGVGGNTGGAAFRNDIIIRGGGPNENVFFIDGIEIPVINHFATQGSSGGPQGILNVSFIEDVTLSSSSFGARYDNALSSVFTFRQKEGNNQRLQGNIRLSASELGLTFDGPLTKNTTFLASARRSYLQFLFQAIDLPIRPNYWDFQFKTTTRINDKTTLTILGVGAIDEFSFAVPRESTPEKEYAIRSVPGVNQWNYTNGYVLKGLVKQGYYNLSFSRNMFNNRLDKFEDQEEGNESKRTLKINSQEIENKLRFEMNKTHDGWKYAYGAVAQYVRYTNSTYNRIRPATLDSNGNVLVPSLEIRFNSAIDFFKLGAFAEVNRKFLASRLSVTLGLRTDGNSFTTEGFNFLRTLSPRASASYALTNEWNINATAGRYHKIPVYPVLGYRDAANNLVNRGNQYIASNHFVTGVEWLPGKSLRITFEAFVKTYENYPVSLANGISLANQGVEFGVLGNEPVSSVGKGRTFGFELFFQKKLTKSLFATLSYTYVHSEFTGLDNRRYIPSAWDSRHLISAIMGYKFRKGWEIGVKYRLAGGAPYTPFDLAASQLSYLTAGAGIPDYSQLNTLRLPAFQQLDLRIDKKVNWRKSTLDFFVDLQNALAIPQTSTPSYTFKRTPDNSGWATSDGNPIQSDGSNAIPLILENKNLTILPTIGIIWEF